MAGRCQTSSGVPVCAIRPSCITTTRSASANASPWSCVTASTVVPNSLEEAPQFDDQPLAQPAVELAERLVQHQQPGARGERAGQRDALLFAAGQRGDGAPLGAGQPDEFQQFGDRTLLFGARGTPHPQPEGDIARDVALREELVVLEHQADPAPVRGHSRLVPPSSNTRPASACWSPATTRSRVDLPLPLGPSTHTISCAATSRSTASSAGARRRGRSGRSRRPAAAAPPRSVLCGHRNPRCGRRFTWPRPAWSVRRRSRASRAPAHTTIKMVDRAIACP